MTQLIVIGCCVSEEVTKILKPHKYRLVRDRMNSQFYVAMTWFYTTDFNYMPMEIHEIENFRLFLKENRLEDKINVYNIN